MTTTDVVATEVVPPFANSAMDGFAVRSADLTGASPDQSVTLVVVDTIHAGRASTVAVGPGEAARIMTGAPMPEGADAVVMVEATTVVADKDVERVQITSAPGVGRHVRGAGEDVQPGDVLVRAGTRLRPAHLALLAGTGLASVPVHPRVRVGVFSTGDELVDPPWPLAAGQIRDTNRVLLGALLAQDGFEVVDLGRARDDADAIEALVRSGARHCDALVSSGGVSMGDADLVKVVLDALGDLRWMQVAIKPAKPFAFGTVAGGVPVFGLPGNPVSCAVSYELLARPGLRRLAGHSDDDLVRPTEPALAVEPLERRADGKTHYLRVRTARRSDGVLEVRSAGGQGSHQLAALGAADALAVVPDGDGIPAGGAVDVLVL